MFKKALFSCLLTCCKIEDEPQDKPDFIQVTSPINIACCSSKIDDDQSDAASIPGTEEIAGKSLPDPKACSQFLECQHIEDSFATFQESSV
jgi:hypothetical protein